MDIIRENAHDDLRIEAGHYKRLEGLAHKRVERAQQALERARVKLARAEAEEEQAQHVQQRRKRLRDLWTRCANTMPHAVQVRAGMTGDYEYRQEAHKWCRQIVGKQNVAWTYLLHGAGSRAHYYFARKDHAALFKLTWG